MSTEANPRARGFGPSRAEVLEHLRSASAAEPVSVIAAAVGLHENTTRFHLDALIELGLVYREAESRQLPGRPRVLYGAEVAPTPAHYQDLARAMVRHFAAPMADRGIRAEQAGEAWASELLAARPSEPAQPLPRFLACLSRLGYRPTFVDGPRPFINLKPCPYAELAAEDPETVCRLHLGLIRGLLDDTDPWVVTALEPYATADRCVVRLALREAVS
jgi:predicted ArsR family transcriptional regulator